MQRFVMRDYLWVGVVLMFVVFTLMKRRGQISIEEAKLALGKGAVILDVRSSGEYAGGAIPGAVNIPLDQVVKGVSSKYPNKDTVLLCHCASGVRSASAVSQLKAAGYANAHNLGGYGRAAKVRD